MLDVERYSPGRVTETDAPAGPARCCPRPAGGQVLGGPPWPQPPLVANIWYQPVASGPIRAPFHLGKAALPTGSLSGSSSRGVSVPAEHVAVCRSVGNDPPSPPSVSSPPPLPSGKPVASRESEYLRSGKERRGSATSDVPRPQLTALCLGPAAVPGRPPSTEGLARGRLRPRASRACVHGGWEFRRQPVLPGAPALDRQLPGFQGTVSPACVSLATGKTAAVLEVACPARASRLRPGGQVQGERSWRGPALQPAPRLRPARCRQGSLRLLRASVFSPHGLCALLHSAPRSRP